MALIERCIYDEDWLGRCKRQAEGDTLFCPKHKGYKCGICGEQATSNCPETMQFVCGYRTCETHKEQHLKSRHRGGF